MMAVFNLNLIETTFFTHNMIHEFKHDTLMIAQSSVRLLIFIRAAIYQSFNWCNLFILSRYIIGHCVIGVRVKIGRM